MLNDVFADGFRLLTESFGSLGIMQPQIYTQRGGKDGTEHQK
jgi:hypothetical protein